MSSLTGIPQRVYRVRLLGKEQDVLYEGEHSFGTKAAAIRAGRRAYREKALLSRRLVYHEEATYVPPRERRDR